MKPLELVSLKKKKMNVERKDKSNLIVSHSVIYIVLLQNVSPALFIIDFSVFQTREEITNQQNPNHLFVITSSNVVSHTIT